MPAVAKKHATVDLSDPRLKELQRDITFQRDAVDVKKRTVDLAFASENPVERYYGDEVLMCNSQACDMSRLNDGAPLLFNHNPDKILGVVERAYMGPDAKARATVRFSQSPEADKYFKDVQDGILRKVSVGYRVNSMKLRDSDGDDDTYEVDAWEPYEISLVSLPADSSVGVGRSQTAVEAAKPTTKMAEPTSSAAPAATPTVQVTASPDMNAVRSEERNRVSEINVISTTYKVSAERTQRAISSGESLDNFRKYVLEEVVKATPVTVPAEIGMSPKDKKRYNLLRAINCLANHQPVDGLEGEVSKETAIRTKRGEPQMGFTVPHDMGVHNDPEMTRALMNVSSDFRRNVRALTASNFTAAGAFVQTDVLGGSLIELLRNKTLVAQLGAVQMSGLVGNVAIPKQTGASTAYWLAEGGTVTNTSQAVSQLGLTPKRLSAQTGYTKQFLAQSSVDAEAFVRDDLMRVMAIAKDLAAISGTGGSQPLGIINTPLVNKVTIGGTASWAKALEFETDIVTANADIGTINWLSNITVKNKWKQIAKIGSQYPIFLVDDEGRCNGYPFNVTNQIGTAANPVANQVILGVFSQAIMADWAGFDVVVDPYTQAANAQILITVNLWTDFGLRHPQSFAYSTDSGAQ